MPIFCERCHSVMESRMTETKIMYACKYCDEVIQKKTMPPIHITGISHAKVEAKTRTAHRDVCNTIVPAKCKCGSLYARLQNDVSAAKVFTWCIKCGSNLTDKK